MKKLFLALFMMAFIHHSFAQTNLKKEDRKGRLAHEFEMYKNPKTGQIPKNIRAKELDYIRTNQEQLKSASGRINVATLDWNVRGPFNQGGRTKAIGIDVRDENILLAGGTSGGMFRSTDGGTSWTSVTDPMDNPAITGVAQSTTNNDVWYYITGEVKESVNDNQSSQLYVGDGVFKSTNNGVSWTQLASTNPSNDAIAGSGTLSEWQFCHDIAIDPNNGAILVTNVGGVYRSDDEGASWTNVIDAATTFTKFGDAIHIDVAKVDGSSSVYYASTHSSGSVKGFFRSDDGITWSQIPAPTGFEGEWERILVSIAKSNTNVAWFLASGSQLTPTTTQLLKYDHSNTTWTDFTSNIPSLGGSVGDFDTQSAYNMVMAVKPDDENVVFIADTKLWRSTDGFTTTAIDANTGNTTWIGGYSPDNNVETYPNHHPDVHELIFFPNDPNKVLCGHDGGVSMTTNILANDGVPSGFSKPHPVTWTLLNNGLFTTQAYAISIDPATSNSYHIVAGFQDNGNFRVTQDGASSPWNEEPYGGDGSWNAIAPGGDTWYISQQNGTIERNSTDTPDGPGVNPSDAGSSSTNLFISPFILDRNDADIMYYAANTDLWRNNTISTVNVGGGPFDGTDEGWTKLTLGSVTLQGNITAMETSVTPANVLYIGTSTGELYKIDDANTGSTVTLTDIFTGKNLSTGFINSIDVDPSDANKVYITFSNYGIISIYMSSDAGQNWIDISGNLEENVDGSGAGPAVRWIHVFKKSDDSDVYYVGATTGLYSTETLNGTNTTWTQEGTSTIGNVPVSMIRSRKSDGYIAVGTHGKGMFSANFSGTTDVTAPTVSTLSPLDDATDVAIDTNLTVTFDENVVDGGGSIIIKNGSDNSIFETISIASNLVTISGSSVIVNPTNDLLNATNYYVEISSDAFEDESGNSFAGISAMTTWNFTTIAETSPIISSTNPSDDATDIEIEADLTITFSKNVVDGGGNITIMDAQTQAAFETIDISSSLVTINNNMVTIDPAGNFLFLSDYFVLISTDAFEDEAGNTFDGISNSETWNFTTIANPDVTAPTIMSLTPQNAAIDISIDSDLTITFSESVLDGGGNITILDGLDDSVIESISIASTKVTINDSEVIIDLTDDLIASNNYYIQIDGDAFEDEAGNTFAGIADKTTWSFSTVSVTGIEINSIKNELIIIPFEYGLNIKFLNKSIKNAEINIYDMQGKLANYRSKVYFKNSSINIKSRLNPGIYIIIASTKEGIYTQKFIKK